MISRRRVAAFLRTKLHRVDQVHPLGDCQRLAALVDIMQESYMLGYSAAFVTKALDGVRHVKIRDLAVAGQAIIAELSRVNPGKDPAVLVD